MPDEQYERVKSLFLSAVEPPPEERSAFLAEACGDDGALRGRVEALLRSDAPTPFDDEPSSILGGLAEELVGRTVGRFEIKGLLGRGGFGVVYHAEQVEPVRREVALKVIRPGFGSAEIVRRFEAERQALALMDHPNVARIFDAGTLPDGRPYFVMELVRGEPITVYCERFGLGVEQRLELFLGVCDAVRHAHAKGVIHRDIKPSNILVSGEPGRPRVIDFGIAKALEGPLAGTTLATERGALIGTPEYMSPEQASQMPAPPDTRIDVYALGVLLYELLTGLLPFDRDRLRSADLSEIQRIIREETPPRPSQRVARESRGAGGAGPTSRGDSRLLRGDLDWIVMRCLEKDAGRRYATVDALATDVIRYLRHEPVDAGPPSASYRAGKFLRRHRGPVAAAVGLGLVLVGATGVSARLALSESRQRAEAERRRAEAERLSAFQASIITGLDASLIGGGLREVLRADLDRAAERARLDDGEAASVVAGFSAAMDRINATDVAGVALADRLLDTTSARIGEEFGGEPELEASLRLSLARAYESLGRLEPALREADRVIAINERLHGAADAGTLEGIALAGRLLCDLARFDESLAQLRPALDTARAALGDGHRTTISVAYSLGWVLRATDQLDEGERWLRFAVEQGDGSLLPDDDLRLLARQTLSLLLVRRGEAQEAERLAEEVVSLQTARFGPDHPSTLASVHALGTAQRHAGKLVDSAETFRRVVERASAALGESHPDTLTFMMNLGAALRRLEQLDESREILTRVLEERRRVLGSAHPDTADTAIHLSFVARGMDERMSLLHEAARLYTLAYGPDHPYVIGTKLNISIGLRDQGQYDEAIVIGREVIEARERALGPNHPETLIAQIEAGE